MLGFTSSIFPKCGYSGLSTAIQFIIGSLFANASVPINSKLLVRSQPSDNTLHRLVEQNDAQTVLLVQDNIHTNNYMYISADKGNKKGN